MDYQDFCFQKLLESNNNRKLIQHLRIKIFREVDFQPKVFEEESLPTSIKQETYQIIEENANLILALLMENEETYIKYFMEDRQGLSTNVRHLLLPDEATLFRWEMFYCSFLKRFLNDKRMFYQEKNRYFQMIYDTIIKDMHYGDKYDYIRIVSDDSDSE